jgi:hypothetical protein
MSVEALDVLAYRGYLKGAEVLACEFIGFTPYVPKPLTSGAKAGGGSASSTSSTHREKRHVSVSCWRSADLALYDGRE